MSAKKFVLAGIIGEVLEWYDFSLYGFLTPILASLFFPVGNAAASLLATFGGFAAGFLMRPLGALAFGHYGDRLGRRKTLAISLLIIGIPTVCMGLLPTYAMIGIAAPLLLIALRLLQGFSCGGEFTGAMIFLAEFAPRQRRALFSSAAWMGAMLGGLLGSAAVTVVLSVASHTALYSWGWRVPFWLGILAAAVGFYIRSKVAETPAFLQLHAEQRTFRMPLVEAIKHYKKELWVISGMNIQPAVFIYLSFIYMPTYVTKILGLPLKTALLCNTLAIAVTSGLIPVYGWLADKIGKQFLLRCSAISISLAVYPVYALLLHKTLASTISAELICSVLAAMAMAPGPGVMAEMVPTAVRFSSVSMAYNITYCFFGGTAPMLATYLISISGSALAPAYYVLAASLLSLAALGQLQVKPDFIQQLAE